MMIIEYVETPEFQKDFKNLLKRYKTLKKDFEVMKKNLLEVYYLKGFFSSTKALVNIENFCSDCYTSQKIRKFACASLKGRGVNSGIRIILVHEKQEQHKVTFVQIYFKADNETEDKERLKKFIKTIQPKQLNQQS